MGKPAGTSLAGMDPRLTTKLRGVVEFARKARRIGGGVHRLADDFGAAGGRGGPNRFVEPGDLL
jgi:hypothetical protein